jgi:hypothetical protein
MSRIEYTEPAQATTLVLTTIGVAGAATLIGNVLNIPVYAAGTVTGADEGITLNGTLVELGYPVGDPSASPFTVGRRIDMNGQNLELFNGYTVMNNNNPLESCLFFSADATAPTGHYLMEAEFFNEVGDMVPWRLQTLETDNGDGTFDHIIVYGFNHSHSEDAALPGWFESSEYHYLTHNYERHIQIQAYASELRLLSYTYEFNAVSFATDTCLLFVSFTLFEMRTLTGVPISAYSLTAGGTDFGVNSPSGITGYIEATDDGAGTITMMNTGTNVAGTDYVFEGWKLIYFDAVASHSIYIDPSDWSLHADGVWVANPLSNTFFIDNASTLDLQINFQPSRNTYHMIVSTATADWGDYIPQPNTYTRSFYAIGSATPMLQLTQNPTPFATFSGFLITGKPFGGITVAESFEIGSAVVAATALDTTQYIEVWMAGALRKLLVGL